MEFLSRSNCVRTTLRMNHMDTDKTYREKARQELHKNDTNYIEQSLDAALDKTTEEWPPLISKTNQIR